MVFTTMLVLTGCQSRTPDKSADGEPESQATPAGGLVATPLNRATPATGRFSRLSADQTGRDFSKDLQPANMRKYLLNGAGVASGDYDNDGRVDVFAVSQDGPNRLFRQTAAWKFQDVTESAGDLGGGKYLGTGASFADVNNDGWLDLYVCNIDGPNQLFINRQDGTFAEDAVARNAAFAGATTMGWGLDHEGVSQGATLADIDRDGDLDLIVNNMNEPLGVYRNDLPNGNQVLVRLAGTRSNRFGAGARVTISTAGHQQIRRLNLARGYMSCDEPLLHFGLGDHDSIDELLVEWPSGINQRFANVDANQLLTITEGTEGQVTLPDPVASGQWMTALQAQASGLDYRHVEYEIDDFLLQPLLPNKLSQLGPGMAWGDVNADGRDDCFVGGAAGRTGRLLVQQPDARFVVQSADFDPQHEDMGAVFLDVDADQDLDLYVASGGYERSAESDKLLDRLYLNDGQGNFASAPDGSLPQIRAVSSCVAAVDYDRDGDLDLFVGSRVLPRQWPLPASSYLLENRQGRFVDVTADRASALHQVGLVTAATWSDVDADGWPDLMLALEWGPVRYLRNDQGTLVDHTVAAGLDPYTGWWNSIAGGDVDNDGDIDFVAMNAGLNTKYHATREHPVLLYADDFDDNGTLDLVEAEWEGDVCFPVRGRSCSSEALPFLQEKFPTFHEFALADLARVYSDESLQQAQRFAAAHLASAVLLNDGTGRFEVLDLPRLAQISPGFGVAIEDFDGDGLRDLCIAQNFLHPQPETGQLDGGMGQMLRGLGNGRFAPVGPAESGILVPGQGMALSIADLNRDLAPDLVMSVNNEPVRAWENTAETFRTRLTIQLQGVAGNPAAIGSRVVARSQSGMVQAMEVRGGGGYLSQSTSTLFLSSDPADPVEQLTVTWPDGSTQQQLVDSDEPRVEIVRQSPVRR